MSSIYRLLKRHRWGLFWIVATVALSLPWMERDQVWRGLVNRWATLPEDNEVVVATSKRLSRPGILLNCSVLKVHDGDTMRVQCGNRRIKVRLHCIDAPELAQTPWGGAARDYLRTLAGKGPVIVEIKDKDQYQRWVGEVWKEGTNLNLKMVSAGLAAVYRKHCHSLAYRIAESKARLTHAGIWEAPGLHQRPWEYRHWSHQ